MDFEFYFFDQYSRASHVGGVYRQKRYLGDLNQALYHVKVSLSIDDEDELDRTRSTTPSQVKQQPNKTTGDVFLQTILRKLKTPIIPDVLTKELDTKLQLFYDKSEPTSPSKSVQSIFVENKEESVPILIEDADDEDELMTALTNIPKVSLPGILIVQLHSTWSDLIKNAEHNFKVWRTKAGEDAWRQYVKQKRFEQFNPGKQQTIPIHKPIHYRRTSSRISIASSTNLSHRQSLITNSKIRLNRSFSRASFLSTSNTSQDNLRLLKATHHANSDHVIESIHNGIHVEFQLSTQIDEIRQKSQSVDFSEQKMVVFDVSKSIADSTEDIINSIQNKCKLLLMETKQKILETTNESNSKICRVWFYEDNQFIRNKTNLLTLNPSNRQQKTKFVHAILRREIPEKYNIDIQIPETKHKCYVELADGSTQIYYPSGRLAVLRLRSPFSTTLFFDDTNLTDKQFLGLVTSTGSVLLMQPTFHARFVTDNKQERAYLCNGKTGVIEKQLQWCITNNCQRESISIDEDDVNPPLMDNIVQLQLNSFMQLEYHNPTNILFAFSCQNEEFKYQLGAILPVQPPKFVDLTKAMIAMRRFSDEKKLQTKFKSSNLINTNELSNIQEKQIKLPQLPMMGELIILRKRIKHICHSWLKECRTTLGILNIDAYCLPDFPSQPILEQNDIRNHHKSAKHPRYVPILTRRASINNDFITPIEKQRMLRRRSFKETESNVISNIIEHFVPSSDAGRTIKQRIYDKKKIIPITLPVIGQSI